MKNKMKKRIDYGCVPPGQGKRRCAVTGLVLLLALACFLPAFAQSGEDDFPPLTDPNRPTTPAPAETVRAATPPPTVAQAPAPDSLRVQAIETGGDYYRLGVGDELSVSVLGQPDFSRAVRVRPDGLISLPGTGPIFALSKTPEQIGQEIQDKLEQLLRHPRVDLMVDKYSDRRVYVMGEVVAPGEFEYLKGMSALQAIGQAGGFKPTAKTTSVVLLRRTSETEAHFRRLDLRAALDGSAGEDTTLLPYDIVYVPRTFIANVDIFIDQFVRPMIAPFTLYIEGWNAFHIGQYGYRIYP
jgi:protein involved in polysaccharide export with SLBB domain